MEEQQNAEPGTEQVPPEPSAEKVEGESENAPGAGQNEEALVLPKESPSGEGGKTQAPEPEIEDEGEEDEKGEVEGGPTRKHYQRRKKTRFNEGDVLNSGDLILVKTDSFYHLANSVIQGKASMYAGMSGRRLIGLMIGAESFDEQQKAYDRIKERLAKLQGERT
jgi:hypothetical protein